MRTIVSDNKSLELNDEIFNFLSPSDNVILSDISSSDKVNIIMLLKKYYLELRKSLGLNEDITFGLEIEFGDALIPAIEIEMNNIFGYDNWVMVPEDSFPNGAEINSPILTDNEKIWIDLSNVCDIVNSNAYVTDSTSGHIHIGVQIFGNNPKYWRNFALLWATYENIIFRFLYGEYISHRSVIGKYATPVALDFINNLDRIEDRSKMINASYMFKVFDSGEDNVKLRRRKSINFTNVSKLQPYMYDRCSKMNTVECRVANGTFNPIIWQNNVNLIVKLMLYCKSDKFDEDVIMKRMRQMVEEEIPSNIYRYSRIYNDQAIEFADLVFDNNLDKIYFLRQYLKDGTVSSRPFVKSKQYTRR